MGGCGRVRGASGEVSAVDGRVSSGVGRGMAWIYVDKEVGGGRSSQWVLRIDRTLFHGDKQLREDS